MTITFAPKVGEILECNYGDYLNLPTKFDGHLPPEMVKNRLVVVLNGKINGNACIVVPLSTTCDANKLARGLHVELPAKVIPPLGYFTQQVSWAKADLVQQVSKDRLFRSRMTRGFLNFVLPPAIVAEIQRAVIKSINATALLAPVVPASGPAASTSATSPAKTAPSTP